MEEYLAPGVYVEEFDSGVKAMEGVGTSTAGFIGLAERGPVDGRPTLVTSFADYQRRFGGYLSALEFGAYRFLPNSVEQFFTNGGSSLYVMRVVPSDAKIASSSGAVPSDSKPALNSDTVPAVTVQACSPGAWANVMQAVFRRSVRARTQILSQSGETGKKQYTLKNAAGFRTGDLVAFRADGKTAYRIVKSVSGTAVTLSDDLPDDPTDNNLVPKKTLEACGVDLQLLCGDLQEVYERCSLNPEAPDYLVHALAKSNLAVIKLQLNKEAKDPLVLLGGEETADYMSLSLYGGLNGKIENVDAGTFNGVDKGPGKRSGIEAFQEISDVSIMAVPGVCIPEVQAKLIAHCEGLANRFAVLDASLDCTGVDELNTFRSAYDTSYAALYAPWVNVYDPLLRRPTFLPPSGSVCGIYARTDIQRGVHKAPANEVVRACTGLSVSYNEAEQGKLNPNGVNLIRALPGQGIRVWGARTCSSDGNWKYLNVRRLFIFLEESIRRNTAWAVFEPNDENLWSRVKSTIMLFLETQRRNGALMGTTAEQAYYVEIGSTTMSEDDILNGRLICEIGVAPVRPAEFVIFRITQKMQDAT
ncbi:MAG: phage tail sheath family protein [Clostridiaceae bacterium]|nr:phage tail sheath family protein [Clostridiaceae bacterium]